MPVLSRAINEQQDHIFMPVISQLSHRILQSLEFEDVIGDQIYINTDWSTHSITSDSTGNADVAQNFFQVDVNIQLNPTSQKWDMYTFHHTTAYGIDARIDYNEPIYYDKPNQVRMLEIVSPVSIVMNCNLTVQSSVLAFQAPQQIFNAHENGAVWHYNDLFFDYPVPKPILSVLLQIWKQDRVYGKQAGVDFIKYIKQRSNNGWNVMKHRELDEYEIVIPVYDLKALCTLEYSEDRPQGVMEGKLPVAWSIPFVFTVQFSMPTLNILKYPCIINNQLLPETCIPVDQTVRHNRMPEYHHGKQDEDYDKMKKQRPYPSYTQVPWYDDWIIPKARYVRTSHTPFLVLDLLVEEDKELNIIDLKEDTDPSYALTPLTKEFLYQEGVYALDTHSPYHITMFRDGKELTPVKDFYFDDSLILRFKAIDKVSRYRIILTIMSDVRYVNPIWLPLLFKYYPYLGPLIKDSIRTRILYGDLTKDIEEIIKNSPIGKKLIDDYEKYGGRGIHKPFFIDENGNIYDANKKFIINISNYDPIEIHNGDYNKAYPKPESVLSNTDFNKYFDDEIYTITDDDYDKWNIEDKDRTGPSQIPSVYKDINDYGGSDENKDSNESPNKGNIGRISTPYEDRGVTANAYNPDARVFGSTIITRKAANS